MSVSKTPKGQQPKVHLLEEAIEKSAKSAKEGRLIVRNVGFNVNVEQLRKRFEDFGELVEVVLPPPKRTTPFTPDGRKLRIPPHAGYAFVEFDTREQAQAAITGVNGNRIGGRQVAVDFSYDSRIYKAIKEREPATPAPATLPKTPIVKKSADEEIFTEDPVSVETPSAREKPKKLKLSQPEPEQTKEVETAPVEVKPKKEKKAKQDAPKPEQKANPDSRKLFLLNVPFEADRKDIQEGLCSFANLESSDIESVLFVKDKETDKPSGKCFVVFKSEEIATKVLDLETSSRPQLFGDLYKNKDGRPAVAPLEGAGCIIQGRRISVAKPLSKKELEERKFKLEEENQPKNPKVVNRKNIDFINAGWINENHEELWADLPPRDQKMRQACNEEKKIKLKNPNYVINTKRLMVRNIPKQMENGDLQSAIVRAMGITGAKKVKQAGIIKVAIVKDKVMVAVGDRPPRDSDFDMTAPDSDDETKNPSNTKMEMKEKKKSRGFAFVDFVDSDRAMKCLEAMNNVPGAFGAEYAARRPIVEFSFDDVRKLQIQKNRALKTEQSGKQPVEQLKRKRDPSKLTRGQRQRAKRRALREGLAQ